MQKQNKKKKLGKVLLVTGVTLVVLAGVFLIFFEPLKAWIRSLYTDQAVDAFKQGETTIQVPITDMLSVDGENGEHEVDAEKLAEDMADFSVDYGSLTLIGLMEIPCVEIEQPIFSEVSTLALRYGCGKFGGTANIGESGLCSVWGHRDLNYLDSALGKLQFCQDHIGEKVYITTPDMRVHEYEIIECVYAKDGAVMPWMYKDTYDEEMLCIVTCGFGEDPARKGNYYPYNTEFVVVCKPVSVTLPSDSI